ncbi:MAG: ABC transporter permease [Acidimicrobiia bacterium]
MKALLNTGPIRVVERELRVFDKMWRGSLFGTIGFPVLFLASLGIGVGGLVNEGTGKVGGLSYLDFVAPGLMAASALQATAGRSMWPIMAGTKWNRFFHAMIATPLDAASIHAGIVIWAVLQALLSAVVFLVVAAVLGGVSSWWAPLSLAVVALLAAAVCAPLSAFSAAQEGDAPFNLIMRLGVQPLFLFSGTFFPLSNLPSSLRPLAQLSPLYHAVELTRACTTGRARAAGIPVHLAVLTVMVVAGLVHGRRTFERKLTP